MRDRREGRRKREGRGSLSHKQRGRRMRDGRERRRKKEGRGCLFLTSRGEGREKGEEGKKGDNRRLENEMKKLKKN